MMLAIGCNAPEKGKTSANTVIDTPDTGSIAVAPLGKDSIASPIHSIPEVRQDSPKKSQRQLAEERRLAQKPRTFFNIGAPDDRLPSIKNYEQSPEGKAFFDLIRREWSANTNTGVFKVKGDSGEGFRGEFPNGKKWLHLIPQADIETLFGKPSRASQVQLTYYMNDTCLGRGGTNAGGCEYLKVELTHDKLANEVSIVKNPSKE